MYELIQAAENTFYIECPTKIGICRVNEKEVWLIDSGNDKDAARKVIRHMEAQNWKIVNIINTHSNADHCGGNEMLQRRTGCGAFSTLAENAVILNPILEPSLLYGGYPPKAIQNKFLMAQPSFSRDIKDAVLPDGMEIFPLPGHYLDMIGVKTPDDVYFLADSLFSEETIAKYHISYLYDVKGFFATMDMLEGLNGKLFIPSHCQATTDIKHLIAINRSKTLEVIEKLLEICNESDYFESILQKIFKSYNLVMDMNQYVLVGSCIRSYLAYLVNEGKMAIEFQDCILKWHSVSTQE